MKHVEHRGKNKKIGSLGETIACQFLMKHGFSIIDRNFLRKCGEIDIIAQKQGIIYFCEVKTVSQVTFPTRNGHLPEENVDRRKLSKMYRTIELYFASRGSDGYGGVRRCGESSIEPERPFEIRVISVVLNSETRRARVKMLECL